MGAQPNDVADPSPDEANAAAEPDGQAQPSSQQQRPPPPPPPQRKKPHPCLEGLSFPLSDESLAHEIAKIKAASDRAPLPPPAVASAGRAAL